MADASEDLLNCAVCFSSYNREEHLPVVGSCGHTICIQCAQSLYSPNCPICRAENGFLEWKTNFLACDVIEQGNLLERRREELVKLERNIERMSRRENEMRNRRIFGNEFRRPAFPRGAERAVETVSRQVVARGPGYAVSSQQTTSRREITDFPMVGVLQMEAHIVQIERTQVEERAPPQRVIAPPPRATATPQYQTTRRRKKIGCCGKMCGLLCFIIILVSCILCPPLAVFLRRGCTGVLCCNIILTLLGWIPGVIHACCVMVSDDDDDD